MNKTWKTTSAGLLGVVMMTVVIFASPQFVAAENNVMVATVQNASDDARNIKNRKHGDISAATHYMGKFDGKTYVHGLRFANVELPIGARVIAAELQLYSAGGVQDGKVEVVLQAETGADSTTFRDRHNTPGSRSVSAMASRQVLDQADWSTQGFGDTIAIDVSNIVANAVTQDGWESGNAVTIIQASTPDSTGYVSYSTYDRDEARAPRLMITYKTSITNTVVDMIDDLTDTIQVLELEIDVQTSPDTVDAGVMAWMYPGRPACVSSDEYSDGRIINFLKPEYFTVTSAGQVKLLDVAYAGCNGFSPENVASVQANSDYSFVTVSAGGDNVEAFFNSSPSNRSNAISTFVSFVVENNMTGVEIDFEGYGAWSSETYSGYKAFLQQLGDELHAANKQLMVDIPPIGTTLEQSYYELTYQEMAALPIDYLVVMAYDYQYDYGAGKAVAPNAWVRAIVEHAQKHISVDRLVIGLPSYGYYGREGSYALTITASEVVRAAAGNTSFSRDALSYEMKGTKNGISYVYQDQESLDKKRAMIESLGVKFISVWALGGNEWFSE